MGSSTIAAESSPDGSRRALLLTKMSLACAATILGLTIMVFPTIALAADAVPVYRLFNIWDGQHLITADGNEYKGLVRSGWRGEGIKFLCPASGSDVYRLYNPYNGDHLYTADADEYTMLQQRGWRGEGVKLHGVEPGAGKPVYRLFNPWQTANGGLGSHLWTTDGDEYDSLPVNGWVQEDPAWYALEGSSQVSGTINRGGYASSASDWLVEVYDGYGNCLATQALAGSQSDYSFPLVPGSYKVVTFGTSFSGETGATIRYMQADVALSDGRTATADFDFGRFSAGNSACGLIEFKGEMTDSRHMQGRMTARVPGGGSWTYTTGSCPLPQGTPVGVYGVRNGLVYVSAITNGLSGVDVFSGSQVWLNRQCNGCYIRGWSLFLPNGDLVLPVDGIGDDFGLVNQAGQMLVRTGFVSDGFVSDVGVSYANGMLYFTVYGANDDPIYRMFDVSRFV